MTEIKMVVFAIRGEERSVNQSHSGGGVNEQMIREELNQHLSLSQKFKKPVSFRRWCH